MVSEHGESMSQPAGVGAAGKNACISRLGIQPLVRDSRSRCASHAVKHVSLKASLPDCTMKRSAALHLVLRMVLTGLDEAV